MPVYTNKKLAEQARKGNWKTAIKLRGLPFFKCNYEELFKYVSKKGLLKAFLKELKNN